MLVINEIQSAKKYKTLTGSPVRIFINNNNNNNNNKNDSQKTIENMQLLYEVSMIFKRPI